MPAKMLPAMIYRPSQTATANRGGCWTCSSFHGEQVAHGAHVICRQRNDQPRVIASPAAGCAFWCRELGAD